jgi:apolipoprotein N-acyltransferase
MPHFVAAFLSSILLILSFPQFHLGTLAWISLVPLLLSCRGTSPQRAFLYGWITGIIAFSGIVYWIVIAMHQYGNIPFLSSVMILILFAAYLGLFVGIFAALVSFFLRYFPHPSALVWAAPPTWVSLEILRTHLFTGCPWALLGYSQYQWLSIIQIADITGVYGVSFLVVMVNAFLTLLILSFRERLTIRTAPMAMSAVITITFFSLTMLYGELRQKAIHNTPDQRGVRLGLIQANIDQGQKWDPAFRQETMDRYFNLTTQAIEDHGSDPVDLIVWPEAATPFVFAIEETFRDQITALVHTQQTPLLFGSVAVKEITEESAQLLNRAYLLSSQGTILNYYDKIHLVPFGEYVPQFFAFVNKLAHGIGDYVPGNEHTIMSGPHGRFGVAICFEVIYPDLVRQFVKQGAEYMVTITNDAWYDRSSAPYQHFSMVVFRAIENRVPFARAANTGISGFIDADGSIKRTTDLFTQTAIVDTVTVGLDRTVYTIYGDVFAYTCAGFVLGFIFLALGLQKRRKGCPM